MAVKTEFDGDLSLPDNILTMLKDRVMDLVQLSETQGDQSRSKQTSNDDILTSLECLRTEGKVCCKIIKTDEGCRDSLVYWSVNGTMKRGSGTKTPTVLQRTRSCSMWKAPNFTPKGSGLQGRSIGSRSTPSSQFVSPLLKRPIGEKIKENWQTPKRLKYGKSTKEEIKHRESPGTRTTECKNRQDAIWQNTNQVSYESKDDSLHKDNSTNWHSPDEMRKDIVDNEKQGDLKLEKQNIIKDVQDKEECVRKLEMVRKYRTKNNLEELQVLIDKWRHVSQEAAGRLLDKATHEPRPDMTRLLTHLQIDHKLIQYSAEDEEFY